jgi:DNA-binding transcriptional ArsR family regulator
MRPIPAPPAELELSTVLNALADPVRLALVAQLGERDRIACGTFETDVAKSTLSYHFNVLREAGVIETERVGGRALNTLRRAELDAAFPGLLDPVLAAFAAASRRRARGRGTAGKRTRVPEPGATASPARR